MTSKSTTIQMYDLSKTTSVIHNKSWSSSSFQTPYLPDVPTQYLDYAFAQQPEWGIYEDGYSVLPVAPSVAYQSLSSLREPKNCVVPSEPIKLLHSSISRLPLRPYSNNIKLKHSPQHFRQSSPIRSRFSFLPMLTGDNPGEGKVEDKGGKLAGWFKGESEPVNIGIVPSPLKEKMDPFNTIHESSSSRTINLTKRSSPPETAVRPNLRSTGTFSFFKSKMSLLEQQWSPSDTNAASTASMDTGPTSNPKATMGLSFGDEFTKLNIGQALYPKGITDPISPTSFNDLMQNAELLLTRMQTVHKQRIIVLEKLGLDNEAQMDELKSATTRIEHLETRLESMAVEATERDKIVMNLVDDLAHEKQLRREEAEARKRTIKLVTDSQNEKMVKGMAKNSEKPRRNGFSTASDSGFESEGESSEDTTFLKGSRARSSSFSSVSSMHSPDMPQSPELAYAQVARKRSMPPLPPLCTTNGLTKKDFHAGCGDSIKVSHNCQHVDCLHCRGVRASDAWGVANMLSGENKRLKRQMEGMQGVLNDCLGFL